MALSIARVAVGDAGMEQEIRRILDDIGVPASEGWTASVGLTPGGAWEVVLDGAPRTKCEHVDWEIVPHESHVRFRKILRGRDEQNADFFRRMARKLLWEAVQFKDNPIRNVSPRLGEAYEDAVWSLLRHEDMNPVQVRFGVWREGADGMKFVCKVEYASNRRVPWSWWSGLVRTPQDMANELARALAVRRKRMVVTPSLGARRLRRAPALASRPMPHPAAASSAGDGRLPA